MLLCKEIDLSTPFREAINQLPAYAMAEQSVPGVRRTIQLGQNELGVGPSPRVFEALGNETGHLNRYTDMTHSDLRHAIADIHELNPAQVLCGAGSMELLGLIANLYTEPGTDVVVTQFGYKYFQLQCALAGATIHVVPEPAMRIDIRAIADAVTADTRLVFLVNPGNPTGALLEAGDVRALRAALPDRIMLVLDGAYAEFVQDLNFETGFDWVDAGMNIAVLRTFSKAYGLAALRVGWMYAPADVVDAVTRARSPNSIGASGLVAAKAAVLDQAYMRQVVSQVVELRERFAERVRHFGLTALPSHANFVLVGCPASGPISAEALTQGLRADGIIIRPMHSYGLSDHVRVTIGCEEEMALLDATLHRLLA